MSSPDELLNKKYVITMPDGSEWAVPISVIAESYAKWRAPDHAGGYEEALQEEVLPAFAADNFEIRDWASGNMVWEEVKEHATLLRPACNAFDFEEGWVNGDWRITD